MSTTIRCAPRLLFGAAVLVLAMPSALAFYPFGFFDDNQNGQLVIVKWPISAFDTNGDGDVTTGEGIVLNYEAGNDANFFNETEVGKVASGFLEWQLVTTAYVAFQRGQDITEPVELTNNLDSIDAFNVVTFQSDADEAADGDLTGGAYAAALIANTFEDTFVTIGGTTVPITGGQMIDIDSVFAAKGRTLETAQPGTLKGTSVLNAGTYLSLGYSPLSNIDEEASDAAGANVEDRVVAIRNFDGTLGERGVTPSMFNEFFNYDDGGSTLVDSAQDLAPDDIAGVTFVYPRSDQDLFFEIDQRARTQASANFPSNPIAGAWIRAWCDTANDSEAARVPMFDTLTGLYYNGVDTNFRGHFQLKGLLKQLETSNAQTFSSSYVVTCSEFLPLVFPGDDRFAYDSTHGGFNGGTPGDGALSFDTLFPAEVFNESGNRIGLANIDDGTPLVFNLATRKIVSATSGKTLDVILATGRPMFGTQDQTCPLNVIVGPVDTGTGTASLLTLRKFRDKVLLTNPIGTALSDVYYRIAPAAASFLKQHEMAIALAQRFVGPTRWIVEYAEWLLAVVSVVLAGYAARRRRALRAPMAAAIVLIGLLALASQASAQMMPYEISDYLAQSDDVVVGKVTTVESRWVHNNTNIITDVAVRVEEPIKGTQNRGGIVHIELPTGRVGAVGRSSPQLPGFATGEEVLVFLDAQKKGYMVTGGIAGKYLVIPHPKTGQKYVFATSLAGHTRLEREIAKMNQEKAPDGVQLANTRGPMKIDYEHRTLVKLDDFVHYLRDLSKRQDKQTISTTEPAK